MSFTVYQKFNGEKNPCYEKLKKSRLIHVDGFGYFTITSDEELLENKVPSKSISAYSAEYLLNNKGINLTFITTAGDINNTSSTTIVTSNYFFYREKQEEKSLLHQLIKAAPQWSIGYVSPSLREKSRSFSETDKGLYGFLTNEVSQSYEALFIFDNENYVINAYDTTEVIKNTNVVLSFDNLLKNATVSELSDDIYTVINVSGAENLSIAKINPNGTKKLYCLDYYTGVLDKTATNYYENYNEWITNNNLKKKVLEWEKANKDAIYDKSNGSYGSWTSLQKKFNLLLLSQQAALNQMQTYYDVAQQSMSLYTDYSDLDELLVVVRTALGATKYVTYREAKKRPGYTIIDYYQVKSFTTDDNMLVTKYAYWKNYSQACEANLSILKDGGKLYSVRQEDFEVEGSINADYNIPSTATPIANGENLSNEVLNHNLAPSGVFAKYSINALIKEVNAIQSERDSIVNQYSFETYFTTEEKLELDPFLIEGSFSDDTFIVTDSMQTKDYSDNSTKIQVVDKNGNMVVKTVGELKQDDTIMDDIYVASQLVDAGYEKLKVVSQPSFSFEAESANFFFIEKFKPFVEQLVSIEKDKGSLFGCILNIQLQDNNWVYPYLQELEIDYDNPDSFGMKFGNRFRMSNDVYTFSELHNETTSAVSSVGSLLTAVSQPVTNGTIDAVTKYTKTALIASNQSIKATTDNDFTFGSYGIKGRKKSAKDGNINGFDPEQLWITNNKICFTTDGWKTTKAVFGKIMVDGVESYGLVADSIVGKLVMGNNLIISNDSNTLVFNENGMSIENDDISIEISPTKGFDVLKKTASGSDIIFQVDSKGNLTMNGGTINIGIGGGNIGYVIDGNSGTMYSRGVDEKGDPYFSLSADGQLHASGLSVNGDVIIQPGDIISSSGTDGVVNDGGEIPPEGGLLKKLEWLLRILWNPYSTVLKWVGKTDSDSWRKIWGYYSARDIASGRLVTDLSPYFATQSALSDHTYSKAFLDANFVKKNTEDLTYYKTWSKTESYLNENYQKISSMSDYYTSTQINSNFVSNSSLTQNYYSKSDIQRKFDITDDTNMSWKTVTIDGQSYTVLTK